MRASKLHKPHSLLRLNPYHACIKPAQTSRTSASESLSCVHQTCKNLTHPCVWILLIRASDLQKPHPLLRPFRSHACIIPAQTSPTPRSESISCVHQSCTNLTHSCVWILIMHATNLHKPHALLRLNPCHACIKPAKTSPNPCVWILLMRASDLQKPHPLLRPFPSHACIKPAQTSPTPASESLACVHQTCTNLNRSSVWIVLLRAPNLHKHHPLLRRNPSHTCIKPAQSSPTPISESISCVHQTCTNLSHSCDWILIMRASSLHKPHPLLRLNPSHECIKPAQTSPFPVPESFKSDTHQLRRDGITIMKSLMTEIRNKNVQKTCFFFGFFLRKCNKFFKLFD